jgi:glycine betaine/proline transport system permease protein
MKEIYNMFTFPEQLIYKISDFIDIGVDWVLSNLRGFFDFVRLIILNIFDSTEFVLNIIPWWAYLILLFIIGWRLYSVKTGLALTLMLFAIGMFGLWEMMIYTLVIVVISVVVSIIIGLPTGIFMAKSKRLEKVLKPILDAMQTMPSFVYLIPAVMLFGLGKVPAVFATTIYAIPPLIRLTYLGIANVNKEVVEAGLSFGSTPMQMNFHKQYQRL